MRKDELRDKTERGLTCCDGTAIYLGHCPEGCPYLAGSERSDQCVAKLHADALALLKAQDAEDCISRAEAMFTLGYCHSALGVEDRTYVQGIISGLPSRNYKPRVLALEELSVNLENHFLWVEARDESIYHLKVLAVHLSTSGVTDIDFNLPTCYLELSTKTMGKKWRPWTSLPTEEQREAVKWDD